MATSTFTPSNSSLQSWLNFNSNGNILPILPACKHNDSDISCAQVCNDTSWLFSSQANQSSNLLTCGLWTEIAMWHLPLDNDNSTLGSITPSNFSTSQLAPFQQLGLNTSDFPNVATYASTISGCFEALYVNVKHYSYADDGKTPTACTQQDLFPVATNASSLETCLQEICSPLTLNPDLAGIGVRPPFDWDSFG